MPSSASSSFKCPRREAGLYASTLPPPPTKDRPVKSASGRVACVERLAHRRSIRLTLREQCAKQFIVGFAGEDGGAAPLVEAEVALVFPVGPSNAFGFEDSDDVAVVSQSVGARHGRQAAELAAVELETETARNADGWLVLPTQTSRSPALGRIADLILEAV